MKTQGRGGSSSDKIHLPSEPAQSKRPVGADSLIDGILGYRTWALSSFDRLSAWIREELEAVRQLLAVRAKHPLNPPGEKAIGSQSMPTD